MSGSNDHWSWNMTTFTKPATGLEWARNQPSTTRENAIGMVARDDYKFHDMTQDMTHWLSAVEIPCYICEFL